MASDQEFVDFIIDQIRFSGEFACRKMFGEFALYGDGKIVAMVCDNRVFFKPTAGGRAMIGKPVEAAPYPGARPCFVIEDRIDDGEWLSRLFAITAAELPPPKKKTAGTRKKKA